MSFDRRTFLKTTAATGATAALSTGATSLLAAAKKETPAGELGQWVASSCQGCTSWCSIEAYVIDGRAVKVRGNANAKGNHGKICPRPHLALQQVYDPDRVKTPMKRTNPKKGRNEDPKFEPIGWDEAMEMIADKMLALRAEGESHKFALFRGRYTGLNPLMYEAVPKIFGSPNNISHSSICAEGQKFGAYYTEGYWNYNDFDLENTRYVLCWGVDPLSGNRQVPHFINVWGKMRDRAKVTVIDPRFSSTAAKADRWMPVIPGEDNAIALAIAHVLLSEGLWYKPFVGDFKDGENRFKSGESVDEKLFDEKFTHGVVKWWNLELKDRTPEWAAKQAGLEAADIRAVAREMGHAAPRVISWMGASVGMQVRGSNGTFACHALNGLLGSVDNEGGVFQHNSAPIAKAPAFDPYYDDIAKTNGKKPKIDQRGTLALPALNQKSGGGVVTNNVADAMLAKNPYDLKMAIGYWCNFPFSCTGGDRWEKALSDLPFFVHVTTNFAEMTHYADVVIPATMHMFERWGFVSNKQNLHGYCSIQQPMVKPYGEAKDDETGFTWLLAKKLADKGFDNLLRYYQENFKDPETGKMPQNEDEFAQYAVKFFTAPLWNGSAADKGDTIAGWEAFKKAGVWNTKRHAYRKRWGNFKTETKQFEFYSQTLKKVLEDHAAKHSVNVDGVMEACNLTARGEHCFVPHYEPAFRHGDPKQFPLVFVEHRSRLNREGRSQNTPWYYAFKDVDPGDEAFADVLKINPETAAQMGLKNGDKVRVVSPQGSMESTIKLWEGTRPGVVVKCYGQGHWAYGRNASDGYGTPRGGNNNDILVVDYDRLSGSTVRHGGHSRVRIEKA